MGSSKVTDVDSWFAREGEVEMMVAKDDDQQFA